MAYQHGGSEGDRHSAWASSKRRARLALMGLGLCLGLGIQAPARADALGQCVKTTFACAGDYVNVYVNAIEAAGEVLSFAALHPNCVTDFVGLNPVTIGVSTGMAGLKAANLANTEDAYGQAGKEIAKTLATFIPVPALQDIANSSGGPAAGQALQALASVIPVPSAAVPTVDAQIQCGQAIAKSGVGMIKKIQDTMGSAKALVKSCGAVAACFGPALKEIVTNPIGAITSVGGAIVSTAATVDSLWQDANIPSGEYFSKVWYPQLAHLASTFAIKGPTAGGTEMADMYSQCHKYYDEHRMSGSSATETCDQIRGWHASATQPWPHLTLDNLIQQFVDTNSASLRAAAYLRAANDTKTYTAACGGNAVCMDKTVEIFKDAAASLSPPGGASNEKKLALLKPCTAGDHFDIPQCVEPVFVAARVEVAAYAKASQGWTLLFAAGAAKEALKELADLRRDTDYKTYVEQCNSAGSMNFTGNDSPCKASIKKTLQSAVQAVANSNLDACTKGSAASPQYQLPVCLNKVWTPFIPALQAAVAASDKAAADNVLTLAKLMLPQEAAARRGKEVLSWALVCKPTPGCSAQVEKALADAESQALKAGVQACKLDDYNYYIPKCLDGPFGLANASLQKMTGGRAAGQKADRAAPGATPRGAAASEPASAGAGDIKTGGGIAGPGANGPAGLAGAVGDTAGPPVAPTGSSVQRNAPAPLPPGSQGGIVPPVPVMPGLPSMGAGNTVPALQGPGVIGQPGTGSPPGVPAQPRQAGVPAVGGAAPAGLPRVTTSADAERALKDAGCVPGGVRGAPEGTFTCNSQPGLRQCEAVKAQPGSPVRACSVR